MISVNQEERDEELRWRLELLRTKFDEGKIHVAQEFAEGFEKSLMAVRYSADGKINLGTVDGRVRAMALAVAGMHNREREKDAGSAKKTPLRSPPSPKPISNSWSGISVSS